MKNIALAASLGILLTGITSASLASEFKVIVKNDTADCQTKVVSNGHATFIDAKGGQQQFSAQEGDQIAIYPQFKFQGSCTFAGIGNISTTYAVAQSKKSYFSKVALMPSNPGVVTKAFTVSGTNAGKTFSLSSDAGGTNTAENLPNSGATINIDIKGGPADPGAS